MVRNSSLPRKTKVHIYHTAIVPVLLYGLDSLTLTDKLEIEARDRNVPGLKFFSRVLSLMVPAVLLSGLSFLKEGVQTNWWGLACPSHCQSTSWAVVLLTFVIGWLCGIIFLGLVVVYIYWGHFWTWEQAAEDFVSPAASRLARQRAARLRGYLYAEGQGAG